MLPSPHHSPTSFSRYFARATPSGQALLWGGAPLTSIVEPYTDAPGNRRLVQYFDRGRMELDAATGEVSQGLLVRELISGTIQLGAETFVQGTPADIPIMATSANDEPTPARRTRTSPPSRPRAPRTTRPARPLSLIGGYSPAERSSRALHPPSRQRRYTSNRPDTIFLMSSPPGSLASHSAR